MFIRRRGDSRSVFSPSRIVLGLAVLAAVVAALVLLNYGAARPASAQDADSADLSIYGYPSDESAKAGRELTYSFFVDNFGPDTATNTVFEDTLPSGVEFIRATVSGVDPCTQAGGVVTCELGDLPGSAYVEVVIRPTQAGTIENVASVGSDAEDPDTTNNESRIASEVTPPRAAPIAAAITRDQAFVTDSSFVAEPPSGTPNAASSAPLAGFPTHGTDYGILTTGDAGSASTPNDSESTSGGNGGGNVRGNSDRDVSILKVDLAAPSGASCLSMDFKFLSEEFPEFVGSDFNDTFIAELDNSNWTTSNSEISAPNNFAFDQDGEVISINSAGPTSVSEAEAAGTTYDAATRVLTARTPITPGAHSLYLSIFDQGDNAFDSAAFVDNLDLTSESGQNCVGGIDVPRADLSINLTDTPDPATAGNNLTYTLTATNNGPDPATGVVVEGTLPANVEFVSASSEQGSCTGTEPVTCTFGDLASGASAAANIVVRPTAEAVPQISASATVRANQQDLDQANNSDSETTTVPDTTPPGTMINSGPSGTVNSRAASFTFSSSESDSSFRCSLDDGSFETCSSPKSYSGLSDGSHTMRIAATDAAGNTDPTPANRSWTVDATPPPTMITSGPSGTISTTSATFTFSSSEENSTFECKLDGGAFETCASPKNYTGLSSGSHSFQVRATDAANNTDATPANRAFAVDVTAPKVVAISPASGATNVAAGANATATFSEAMLASTISKTTVRLAKKGTTTVIPATVSYSATTKKAALNPTKNLQAGATYTVAITTGVKDLAGNPLASARIWTFKVKK